MPTYIYINKKTGEEREWTSTISAIDDFYNTISLDERDNWVRKIEARAVFQRVIPMGFGIREADSKWQAGKEIAALEDSRYDMRPAERQEVNKEIKRIKDDLKK